MRVRTNDRYNRDIVLLLKSKNTPVSAYAAARIEELETHNAALLEHIKDMHIASASER